MSPPPPPAYPDPFEGREVSPPWQTHLSQNLLTTQRSQVSSVLPTLEGEPSPTRPPSATTGQQQYQLREIVPLSQSLISSPRTTQQTPTVEQLAIVNDNADSLTAPLPADSRPAELVAEPSLTNELVSQDLVLSAVENTVGNNIVDHPPQSNPEQFQRLLYRVQRAIGLSYSSVIARSLTGPPISTPINELLAMSEEEFSALAAANLNSLTITTILPRIQGIVGPDLAQRVAEASAALLSLRDLMSMNNEDFSVFVNDRQRRIRNNSGSNADFRLLGGLLAPPPSPIALAIHAVSTAESREEHTLVMEQPRSSPRASLSSALVPDSGSIVPSDSRGVINRNDLASGQPESINSRPAQWLLDIIGIHAATPREIIHQRSPSCALGQEHRNVSIPPTPGSLDWREEESLVDFAQRTVGIARSTHTHPQTPPPPPPPPPSDNTLQYLVRETPTTLLDGDRTGLPQQPSETLLPHHPAEEVTEVTEEIPSELLDPEYLADDPFAVRHMPTDEVMPLQLQGTELLHHENSARDPFIVQRLPMDSDTYWRLQVRTLDEHPLPLVERAAHALAAVVPQEILLLRESQGRDGGPYYDQHQQERVHNAYIEAVNHAAHNGGFGYDTWDPVNEWNQAITDIRTHQRASGDSEALNAQNSNFYVPLLYRAFGILARRHASSNAQLPHNRGRPEQARRLALVSPQLQHSEIAEPQTPQDREQEVLDRPRRRYAAYIEYPRSHRHRAHNQQSEYDNLGRPEPVSVPSGHRASGSISTQDCMICLETLGTRRRSLTTACNHSFHSRCLRTWANVP